MKKVSFLVLTVIILCGSVMVSAQGHGKFDRDKRERIEQHRIAFITDRLDLTTEEAQQFWPVYNANRDRVEAERKKFRKNHNFSPEDIENMSDEEALRVLDDRLEHEQVILNYKKEFNEALKEVLPPKKILILIESEMMFRERLIREAGRRGHPDRGR